MKALRCDFCNGNLIMDRSREFATCEFCGTKYTKETVQDKIQEIRGTVKIEGAVEAVKGEAEKERLLKNAETYTKLKEFSKALEVYTLITQQFPDDFRGWWGIFTTPIEQYFLCGEFKQADTQALINARKLCKKTDILDNYFDYIISKYGNFSLHKKPSSNESFFSFLSTAVAPPMLNDFSYWLIYDLANYKDYLSTNFYNFLEKITLFFEKELYNGNIYYSTKYTTPPCTNHNLYYDLSSIEQQDLVRCFKRDYSLCVTKGRYIDKTPFYILSWGKKQIKFTKTNYIYGAWLIVSDNEKSTSILFPKTISKESIYTTLHRCQYCGGKFQKRICTKCAKPKDY